MGIYSVDQEGEGLFRNNTSILDEGGLNIHLSVVRYYTKLSFYCIPYNLYRFQVVHSSSSLVIIFSRICRIVPIFSTLKTFDL